MKLGIVGLPNVGKSTLYNAITNAGADIANYPFCTIDPNVGVVSVPDPRLDFLTALYAPKKKTPAVVEFVDIAGLVRGASKGEGLGNKFLSNIRATDAIIHVVRCFEDESVIHVEGACDPLRDIDIINLELLLSDMEMLERRIDKSRKMAKGDKKFAHDADVLENLLHYLDSGKPARTYECGDGEREIIRTSELISLKPVIYAANMDEDNLNSCEESRFYQAVKTYADLEKSRTLPICAKLEYELAQLPEEERAIFLEDLGISESGLDRMVACSYELLGLISFLTAGADECRAWTIPIGTKAPRAAGKIHSDFERGFIRAEIVPFSDLEKYGSMSLCREHGLIRSEGKEYVMRDGDVTLFRFNV